MSEELSNLVKIEAAKKGKDVYFTLSDISKLLCLEETVINLLQVGAKSVIIFVPGIDSETSVHLVKSNNFYDGDDDGSEVFCNQIRTFNPNIETNIEHISDQQKKCWAKIVVTSN